ncbi:hypothetical protein DID88_004475 [Monilinia fructigena]|uniref:Uncharacterized protein n=1 Tax=Monilinia fructigena TaxID=38457 RepID=A0A395IWA3_9HELO|nr:hypothetical protein DID88_004475 [Monilinia fructigena]
MLVNEFCRLDRLQWERTVFLSDSPLQGGSHLVNASWLSSDGFYVRILDRGVLHCLTTRMSCLPRVSTPSSSSAIASATASCIDVTPDKNGYVPEWACNANYNFYPSFAAAVIFTLFFFFVTTAHIFQAFHYKKIRLCWTLVMGCTWELASFAIRSASTKMQQNVALATVSQILVLLAPMWIAKIFVWLDVISFITQLSGGVLISPGADQNILTTGIHIYMGGIGFQEFCILLFTGIAIKFMFIMQQRERSIGVSANQILDQRHRGWRSLLYIMFASLALITTRIIYRLVEFSAGLDPRKNPIPYHEWYFMVLDALPMLIAVGLMNIVHPGRILVGEGSEFPRISRREKKEMKRLRKLDKKAAKEKKQSIKMGKKDDVYIGLDEPTSTPPGYPENTAYPG